MTIPNKWIPTEAICYCIYLFIYWCSIILLSRSGHWTLHNC